MRAARSDGCSASLTVEGVSPKQATVTVVINQLVSKIPRGQPTKRFVRAFVGASFAGRLCSVLPTKCVQFDTRIGYQAGVMVADTSLLSRMRAVGVTLIRDPGQGFICSKILIYEDLVTKLAFVGAAACTTGILVLRATQPRCLSSTGWLQRLLHDSRVPMWVAALMLGLMGIKSAIDGSYAAMAACFAFCGANTGQAQSLARAPGTPVPPATSPGSKVLQGLDANQNLFICAGEIAETYLGGGIYALFMSPLIIAATWLAMRNLARGLHVTHQHPTLFAAAAMGVAAILGVIEGQLVPALGPVLVGATLVNIEVQLTQGGMRQIVADIRAGISRLR